MRLIVRLRCVLDVSRAQTNGKYQVSFLHLFTPGNWLNALTHSLAPFAFRGHWSKWTGAEIFFQLSICFSVVTIATPKVAFVSALANIHRHKHTHTPLHQLVHTQLALAVDLKYRVHRTHTHNSKHTQHTVHTAHCRVYTVHTLHTTHYTDRLSPASGVNKNQIAMGYIICSNGSIVLLYIQLMESGKSCNKGHFHLKEPVE